MSDANPPPLPEQTPETGDDTFRRDTQKAGEEALGFTRRAKQMSEDARQMRQDVEDLHERVLKARRSEPTRRAVFPGTFDPLTLGHLDVIRRGADLFEELVVGVGQNPEKAALMEPAVRVRLIRQAVRDFPGVQVEAFEGLTVDFARQIGATAILRGIRNSSDLQFEFQVALTNRVVAGIETVFVMTSPAYAFTSSSLIRQIAAQGGDVSALVPESVLPYLQPSREPHNSDEGLHETE